MELDKQNILFFTRTMGLGGTENVILQLCEIMKTSVNKIVVCSSGGINVEKLQAMGIKHYEIPDVEKKSIRNVLSVLFTVSKIIKREKITIVHTHHRMAAFYTKLLTYVKHFKFVNTAHNVFTNKRTLTRFAYSNANLIAVGNKVKENLCLFYELPDKQVTVIHNAIKPFSGNLVQVDVIKKYRDEGYFLVGNIGRLSEQKGMEYYIKAAHDILKECPKVKFFIVGEGEDRKKYEKLISDLKITNDVILLGYRNDIQNVMSQLDLIILSSLWEGFPLTPIEAFSVGKTVVATAVDGTLEIVEDGVNGILVKPKSVIELTDKIKLYISNPQKLKENSDNAKESYIKEFGIDIFNKRYLEFYKRC